MAESNGGMRNVWILTVCMTGLSICYTMLVPFLPVYLLELGVEHNRVALWSGVVFSITFFVAGVMAPIWGRMADTRGKKIMAIRAGIFIGIAYILTGFVQDAWQLLATRALMGFANGFMPAAMTMVSLSVAKEKTGTALGIFQTGLIVGNVIGPSLGGLIEAAVGMRPVFFIAGIVLFIASAVVFFFVKEPKVTEEATVTTSSFREDWHFVKQRKVLTDLLWLFFIMQSAILMLQPILALYVGQLQGTMEGAALLSGMILSIGGLAGAVTTNLWAAFGQRKGYFKAVCYALCGTGLFLFLQSMPLGITWFGSLQILVGCFIVGVNPLLSAAVAHYTEPAFRGRVFGMTTTANQFGSMVGPLFASGVTTLLGIQYVFLVTGALLMFVAYQVYRRRVKSADAF
ncbi:MFS transporter [Veillonella criceti]|uniref:Bacillibactin exporter n=1 Tax=Veillonella criceti TaxID=103891 RepID=A0A380NMG2_9FIRM|nr:MFS transporter [Veillonella criceti]SUP44200.1 Bacillibactin exporter [Veillonella criceti]